MTNCDAPAIHEDCKIITTCSVVPLFINFFHLRNFFLLLFTTVVIFFHVVVNLLQAPGVLQPLPYLAHTWDRNHWWRHAGMDGQRALTQTHWFFAEKICNAFWKVHVEPCLLLRSLDRLKSSDKRILLKWSLHFLNNVISAVHHICHLDCGLVHFQRGYSLLRHGLGKATPAAGFPGKC